MHRPVYLYMYVCMYSYVFIFHVYTHTYTRMKDTLAHVTWYYRTWGRIAAG